jgi:hypothetical protein
MSLSCCTQHPTVPILWSQMLNRSVALAATGGYGMDGWRAEQLVRWREQAQRSKGSTVLHPLTRTASTQQTGERCRPGPGSRLKGADWRPDEPAAVGTAARRLAAAGGR